VSISLVATRIFYQTGHRLPYVRAHGLYTEAGGAFEMGCPPSARSCFLFLVACSGSSRRGGGQTWWLVGGWWWIQWLVVVMVVAIQVTYTPQLQDQILFWRLG